MDVDTIVDDFNKIAIDFLNVLKSLCKNSMILDNTGIIIESINNKTTRTAVIDQFLIHVLRYKPQIDENDESFFMDESFQQSLGQKQGVGMIIGELKAIWNKLNDENRNRIFDYMKVLCFYSQNYFLLLENQN